MLQKKGRTGVGVWVKHTKIYNKIFSFNVWTCGPPIKRKSHQRRRVHVCVCCDRDGVVLEGGEKRKTWKEDRIRQTYEESWGRVYYKKRKSLFFHETLACLSHTQTLRCIFRPLIQLNTNYLSVYGLTDWTLLTIVCLWLPTCTLTTETVLVKKCLQSCPWHPNPLYPCTAADHLKG